MALVSMFLCNQSYASHGRDFLLGATILNFNENRTGYLKLAALADITDNLPRKNYRRSHVSVLFSAQTYPNKLPELLIKSELSRWLPT